MVETLLNAMAEQILREAMCNQSERPMAAHELVSAEAGGGSSCEVMENLGAVDEQDLSAATTVVGDEGDLSAATTAVGDAGLESNVHVLHADDQAVTPHSIETEMCGMQPLHPSETSSCEGPSLDSSLLVDSTLPECVRCDLECSADEEKLEGLTCAGEYSLDDDELAFLNAAGSISQPKQCGLGPEESAFLNLLGVPEAERSVRDRSISIEELDFELDLGLELPDESPEKVRALLVFVSVLLSGGGGGGTWGRPPGHFFGVYWGFLPPPPPPPRSVGHRALYVVIFPGGLVIFPG